MKTVHPVGGHNGLSSDESGDPYELIARRIAKIEGWLRENAPEFSTEQRHLEEGAVERIYWHYGYLVALRDIQDLLRKRILN